jgi:hypothetical protein
VQKITLCSASEKLFVAGTAGQVVVLQFEEQDCQREIKVRKCCAALVAMLQAGLMAYFYCI